MQVFKVKRGDTFTYDMQFLKDDNVTPQDLTGYDIRCTIYYDNVEPFFKEDLVVTIVDAENGLFNISKPFADVENWPLVKTTTGNPGIPIYSDVQFTKDGFRVSSDTFQIQVIEDYTDAR